MVINNFNKMSIPCSSMIGNSFDTIIFASRYKVLYHDIENTANQNSEKTLYLTIIPRARVAIYHGQVLIIWDIPVSWYTQSPKSSCVYRKKNKWLRRWISILLKTSNGILQFLSFNWLTGNGIWAHIPCHWPEICMVADTRQRKQLGS